MRFLVLRQCHGYFTVIAAGKKYIAVGKGNYFCLYPLGSFGGMKAEIFKKIAELAKAPQAFGNTPVKNAVILQDIPGVNILFRGQAFFLDDFEKFNAGVKEILADQEVKEPIYQVGYNADTLYLFASFRGITYEEEKTRFKEQQLDQQQQNANSVKRRKNARPTR